MPQPVVLDSRELTMKFRGQEKEIADLKRQLDASSSHQNDRTC